MKITEPSDDAQNKLADKHLAEIEALPIKRRLKLRAALVACSDILGHLPREDTVTVLRMMGELNAL